MMPNVVAAILKNRECRTRFLSLRRDSTGSARAGRAANRSLRVLLCLSVAEVIGGAHSPSAAFALSYETARHPDRLHVVLGWIWEAGCQNQSKHQTRDEDIALCRQQIADLGCSG